MTNSFRGKKNCGKGWDEQSSPVAAFEQHHKIQDTVCECARNIAESGYIFTTELTI